MANHLVLLSVPGLREQDVASMPNLASLTSGGESSALVPSFPCVTWPVQANMLTGKMPEEHGVVANGFFWRDDNRVEMWTAGNEVITAPQIWDRLHQHDPDLTSAVWFPMLSKRCGADYVCMPAPIHNPDGSESLWCYTQPTELYGTLRDELGHFPLQHFWGPLANIKSTAWIVDSAVHAARQYRPNFFYIYLPHLDYAAQRTGPDSPPAQGALCELDEVIGRLASGFREAYRDSNPDWLVASEYTIVPVDHVCFPNRLLREAGLLSVVETGEGEHLDLAGSRAWALVDHQFSHVFIKDNDDQVTREVVDLFRGNPGVSEVLTGTEQQHYHIGHARSGNVIVVSTPHSWQAYYWWLDDAQAPPFARTVDIHNKPGYDPVELHFDPATKSIPLEAGLVRGSHGAPANAAAQHGVLLCSSTGVIGGNQTRDVEVAAIVLRQFGVE